ncbi:response regulator transcription factor [Helicovermis profundi]|uniref:Stage 0 sporulation protein A homolog n=1 Tax=Helicovermis profundi TaxID=3065157 RepID=A0AAU9ERY6_9FIRM|nr:response regulator transcription factor [Clostridia bacterium S502]
MNKTQILIIEDDVNIARLEIDYLEIEGMNITHEVDGMKGLELAKQKSFDLIIIDLMLPSVDGFEILKEIREKFDIPMIMISARSEDIDKIRALGLGADDYITKPFSPSEMVARVKSHLKRYKRLSDKQHVLDEIAIANMLIHTKSHRVYVDNKEITLTTKEFELLLFMATNIDIIFSRNQLFEKIWGMDNYGDIGTVAVHIQKLRKKIEKDPTNPVFIETVWGAGYRMNKRH